MIERPLAWGVLGAASIARKKVIPAIQGSQLGRVRAVASRSLEVATETARELDIEAVYIPLPNHLHAQWTYAAAAAGKHILCEKPLAMTSDEAKSMIAAARSADVKLMEAFMYRLHPLWIETRRLIDEGAIGELRAIQSFFSYRNMDPDNIRNIAAFGGGSLFDIGCYPVNVARMLFGGEPTAVRSAIRRDPSFETDILTSVLLDFGGRHATFTCSTQLEDDQRVHIQGTDGRLLIEIPFNIPPDRPTRILQFAGGSPPTDPGLTIHEIPAADQYRVQADAFALAIRHGSEVPTPPEDAVANLEVLERIFGEER